MAVENPRILTKNYGVAQSWTIDVYEKSGGYQSLRKAVAMEPAKLVDEAPTAAPAPQAAPRKGK